MDPFFLPVNGKGGNKRKQPKEKRANDEESFVQNKKKKLIENRNKKRAQKEEESDESENDSDEGVFAGLDSEKKGKGKGKGKQLEPEDEEDEDPFANETVDEKRVRLAHQYLNTLKQKQAERDDSDDENNSLYDPVGEQLFIDALETAGKRQRKIADNLLRNASKVVTKNFRCKGLPVTCAVLSGDDIHAFTGSKDGSIYKWNIQTGQKEKIVLPESEKKEKSKYSILSIAVDHESKYIATGGTDKLVRLWNTKDNTLVQTFPGHQGTVSGVSFRRGSPGQLYSSSFDRTIKVWNTEDMAYVETLYGHTSEVNCISGCGVKERAVSGGNDTSCRVWKIVEESQLLFKGHKFAIDCIFALNDDGFVSGSQDGSIAIWNSNKKKALSVIEKAHGEDETGNPNWITSITGCINTDLIASGSYDGNIKLWKVTNPTARVVDGPTTITFLFSIPVEGVVNGLSFSKSGKILVAGISQEHRFGRWKRFPKAKNGLFVINLE